MWLNSCILKQMHDAWRSSGLSKFTSVLCFSAWIDLRPSNKYWEIRSCFPFLQRQNTIRKGMFNARQGIYGADSQHLFPDVALAESDTFERTFTSRHTLPSFAPQTMLTRACQRHMSGSGIQPLRRLSHACAMDACIMEDHSKPQNTKPITQIKRFIQFFLFNRWNRTVQYDFFIWIDHSISYSWNSISARLFPCQLSLNP